MMGRPGHAEEKGLIPRSLEQIFQTKQSLQPQGWKYEMQVTEYFLLNLTHHGILLFLNAMLNSFVHIITGVNAGNI